MRPLLLEMNEPTLKKNSDDFMYYLQDNVSISRSLKRLSILVLASIIWCEIVVVRSR